MNKNKISWCLKQKNGIELVEPSDNLCKAYSSESEETLQEIGDGSSKWDVIMAYYASYHALYAILMKCGIKCEIHDCSIELISIIDGFDQEDYDFINELKKKRIKVQYYLKKLKLDNLSQVKKFILKCQAVSEKIEVSKVRRLIQDVKK